jgi:hypothetical protein
VREDVRTDRLGPGAVQGLQAAHIPLSNRSPSSTAAHADAQEWVERTCAAQGVPVKIVDHTTLVAIAVLFGQTDPTGLIGSGSGRALRARAGLTPTRADTVENDRAELRRRITEPGSEAALRSGPRV